MFNRVIWPWVLGMLIASTPAVAEQTARADIQPSAELLEYLGLLEDVQDGLIGPELFDDEPPVRDPAEVDPADQAEKPGITNDRPKIKADETPTTRVPNDD